MLSQRLKQFCHHLIPDAFYIANMETCSSLSAERAAMPASAKTGDDISEVRQLVRYEATIDVLNDLYSLENLDQIAALINSRRKYLASLSGWRLAVQSSEDIVLLAGDKHGHRVEEPKTLPRWDAAFWARQRPEMIKSPDHTGGLAIPEELADPASHEILVFPTRNSDGTITVMSFASGNIPFNALDRKFIRLMVRQLSRHLSHLLMRQRVTRVLQEHAYRDFLTGSLNRQAIVDHLKTQLALSRRMNQPLSVMLVDIDFFKCVNDTYGHPAGDAVLRGLVERFQENIRDSESFGRYGGEEFLFVLYPCTLAQSGSISERVLSAVAARPITINAADSTSISVTVSIGCVSNENQPDLSADELVTMADRALYESKAKGRNCASLCLPATGITETEKCNATH
jgi:diguanylate cyclase (GGDEF)-like protein